MMKRYMGVTETLLKRWLGLVLTLCLACVLIFPASGFGRKPDFVAGIHYRVTVVRVIDGDSVEVDVHIWPGLSQRISIRLDGVDTPEDRTRLACEKAMGLKAKAFTQQFLAGGTAVLTDVHLGKFAGRALGRLSVGGFDLGEALLNAGLARPYFGGKRSKPWC